MPAEVAIVPRALSLFQLEQELFELVSLAEDPELTEDERKTVESRIAEYMVAEVRKVDGIAHAIQACRRNAAAAKLEAERLAEHARAWEARLERIKESAKRAMTAHRVRELRSATHRLRVQGNGGVEPIEITNEHQVPDKYLRITVEVTGDFWEEFLNRMIAFGAKWRVKEKTLDGELARTALKDGPVPGLKLQPRGEHLRVE